MRRMTAIALAAALTGFAIAPGIAATTLDAAQLAPVQRWIDAFNAGKTPLPEDVFTDDAVITDQFPPYVWSGSGGVHTWSQRLNDSLVKYAGAKQHVVTQAPRSVMASKDGTRVSFVLPATLTYLDNGKTVTQTALWLYVVVKTNDGWKIAADTWTRTDG